ncbi:hypothetical protein BDP55DRAFT_342780 [Colletotrichum godetiae]|uniref:Uncharacterized protein n=1 Tax=Colletotrichum godetiae TaxID=1209918 RepID=A0AAJ0EXT5_9PEZI|nr:uncharacterized protein BDP55DRAFT_342780 [Colletotrichum godetiae]KAK1690250.1 hypothetical protein BDP55DRAFT_342780 [Colletotrichum godetiae]
MPGSGLPAFCGNPTGDPFLPAANQSQVAVVCSTLLSLETGDWRLLSQRGRHADMSGSPKSVAQPEKSPFFAALSPTPHARCSPSLSCSWRGPSQLANACQTIGSRLPIQTNGRCLSRRKTTRYRRPRVNLGNSSGQGHSTHGNLSLRRPIYNVFQVPKNGWSRRRCNCKSPRGPQLASHRNPHARTLSPHTQRHQLWTIITFSSPSLQPALPASISGSDHQRRWFSGKILRCHPAASGSRGFDSPSTQSFAASAQSSAWAFIF